MEKTDKKVETEKKAEKVKSEKPRYIERKTVEDAVKALRQVLENDAKSGRKTGDKSQLFEERGMFFVTLALQKAPMQVDKTPLAMFVASTHMHTPSVTERGNSLRWISFLICFFFLQQGEAPRV